MSTPFHSLVAGLSLCLAAITASGQQVVLPPPPPESPIAYFRQLLVMTEEERDAEMAGRPAEQRAGLMAKIEEYSAMSATERELRLRATELRYYLLPMMRLPLEERQARLAFVPEDIRELVESRLTQWMLIPPPLQEQLLENQVTLQLFSRLNPDSAETADELVNDLQLSHLVGNQEDYERWQALSHTPTFRSEKTSAATSNRVP